MKTAIKILFKAFNWLVGILATIFVASIVTFFILWQTGFIKERWPLVHCAISKKPEDTYLRPSDSMIMVIHYNQRCDCDTTYYIKTTSVDATIQRP